MALDTSIREARSSAWRARLWSLASTSSWLTGARLAGALAGFAAQVVLARALKADALGLFYSVTSAAAILGLIAAQGYPAIAPRFMSRYHALGRPGWVSAFIARARSDTAFYVAVATGSLLGVAWLWPGFSQEARLALTAAAMSIPAGASIRVNGAFAIVIRRFALAYLPDTCIRPFLLLGGVLLLLGLGVTLTAPKVTWLLTFIVTALALAQYLIVREAFTLQAVPKSAKRLVRIWQAEAKPLIVVALFTNFFGDVDILMVTPLLSSAETAVLGLCLKLSLLVGFAVQVSHQVVVPDLADARTAKDDGAIRVALVKALGFPLLMSLGALAVVIFFGERVLSIFGPEFEGAKLPLIILMACNVARALFGPSVSLLTVVGAQRENAALAIGSLVVLAVANLVLAPLYGVLGASIAVALATLAWLIGSAIVLGRRDGLRTDAIHLLAGR